MAVKRIVTVFSKTTLAAVPACDPSSPPAGFWRPNGIIFPIRLQLVCYDNGVVLRLARRGANDGGIDRVNALLRRFGSLIGPVGLSSFLFFFTGFAIGQSPNVSALLRAGQQALEAADFTSAGRSFEQARQLAPDNLEANRGLVLSYLQAGRLSEAEDLGRIAVAHWPKDAELEHWLGLTYFKQSKTADALASLQHSEALDGSGYDIHFDVALVLLSASNYEPAASELEKAVKIDPKQALPHVLLGRSYQNTNRSTQAVQQFQDALRIEPQIPLGHYHLGFAYASLGRNQEAIAEYEKELPRSPGSFSVLYQLGHCQLEAGDLESAIDHLKKAAEINPENADAFYGLGKALLLQGAVTDAIPALRRSIALKPTDPTPHYQLSRALEKAGDKEEAKRELEAFAALKKAQPVSGGMAAGPVQ